MFEHKPRDTAAAIAREMIDEVGRWPAIGYTLGRLIGAESWQRARQASRLLIAIARTS